MKKDKKPLKTIKCLEDKENSGIIEEIQFTGIVETVRPAEGFEPFRKLVKQITDDIFKKHGIERS